MSIALLQEKIRARKTPLALVLGPEADKLPARITKNFTDMYGPGDMAQAEALRYHGSQLISQTAPLLPAVVLQAERYLRYGFMGMDVLANLVNMAKAQGLYTIVDARTAAPAVYVEGGIRADGVTVTPYPGSDVCRVGEDKSVFAAVRTGNPSAPEIQNLLSGDRRLYLAAADQMVRHGAALMAETGYVLDVKELRSRAPKAFLLLLGCDGENALPAFDDYGRGALIADTALSIGWSQIAAAAPDGMTIGFMNLPNFNSSIVKGLGTYTTADFAAICNHVTETSLVLVRADDERFNDIDDLVAYAKENKTVASTNGAQASNHIGAQAFANSAGFKYIDLPQGNTADELTSLLGKEADWCVAKAADIAGRTDVKPLAVFSTERIFEFPDVPTLGEKGYYDQWLGSSRCVVAPAGVSPEVIAFYEAVFKATMEDPDYLAAAASFATDYKDAAATAALIEQQQTFTEGLATGFWNE